MKEAYTRIIIKQIQKGLFIYTFTMVPNLIIYVMVHIYKPRLQFFATSHSRLLIHCEKCVKNNVVLNLHEN